MKDENFFDPELPPVTTLTPGAAGSETAPDTAQEDAQEYDTAGEASGTEPVTGLTDGVQATPAQWELLGWSWKAWVGFAALFIVIVTGLLWPDSPAGTPTNAPLEDVSTAGTDNAGQSPVIQPPADSAEVQVMAAQQTYSKKNREAIILYSRRIAMLEQKLTTLETRLAEQDARLATQTAAPATEKKATTGKATIRPAKATRHTSRTSTSGWHVNTLYPGMAWLTHGDSTWAVRPGDTVQGLHITGIDVARRQVITDHGTIR